MRPTTLTAAFGLLVALACTSGSPPSEGTTPAAASDELCDHGVQATVCTKHVPALIPVFQARGDWCAEHGFALSFCPIHHPERGGRPVPPATTDDELEGLAIRFRTRSTADAAGIDVAAAEPATDAGGVEATAHLTWDAAGLARVGARAPGVVQAVRADVGARVQVGDPLAVVQSATASADRQAAAAARARVQLADQSLARKRSLGGVVSAAEIARAEQEVTAARADLAGATSAVGYTLTAPIAGVVTRRDTSVGASVAGGETLFEIVDASRLWAEIDVPEAEVGSVSAGQTAWITLDGRRDDPIVATLDYVAPSIDPETRTIPARAVLDNADGHLRANMMGTARIAVGGEREVLVVPSAAVQRVKDQEVVFRRLAVDAYETRVVQVLRRQGDRVWVTGGVAVGDEVVTVGSFLLKTEILKDSIGAGCCDVE